MCDLSIKGRAEPLGEVPRQNTAIYERRKESGINIKGTSPRSAGKVLRSSNLRMAAKALFPTLGWGKHSVRLYAGRIRRGKAPAPPAPEGEKGNEVQRGEKATG